MRHGTVGMALFCPWPASRPPSQPLLPTNTLYRGQVDRGTPKLPPACTGYCTLPPAITLPPHPLHVRPRMPLTRTGAKQVHAKHTSPRRRLWSPPLSTRGERITKSFSMRHGGACEPRVVEAIAVGGGGGRRGDSRGQLVAPDLRRVSWGSTPPCPELPAKVSTR